VSEYIIGNGIKELQAKGIDAGQYEESFVENILRKRMVETKCLRPDDYFGFLNENQNEFRAFEMLLQNSYSEFFRNTLTFAVLEKIVFPSLVAEKRRRGTELRIWSAACASGQEPYSLVILLEVIECGRFEPFRYRIFASDKSKIQIEHAQKGRFSKFNLGQVSMKRLSKWFEVEIPFSDNTHHIIRGKLREKIDFSVFDLLEEHVNVPPSSIFGDFDLVLCANLLSYYKPAFCEIILNKLARSMAPGGLLVVGESERELLKQQGFTEIFYKSELFRF